MGKFYVINSSISGHMNFMQQKQDRKKTDKKKKLIFEFRSNN